MNSVDSGGSKTVRPKEASDYGQPAHPAYVQPSVEFTQPNLLFNTKSVLEACFNAFESPNNATLIKNIGDRLIAFSSGESEVTAEFALGCLHFCSFTLERYQDDSFRTQIITLLLNIVSWTFSSPDGQQMLRSIPEVLRLDSFMAWLSDEDPDVIHSALLMIAYLTTQKEFHGDFVKLGLIEELLKLAQWNREGIQLNIARTLSNLASSQDTIEPMRSAQVTQALVTLCTSDDYRARAEAESARNKLRRPSQHSGGEKVMSRTKSDTNIIIRAKSIIKPSKPPRRSLDCQPPTTLELRPKYINNTLKEFNRIHQVNSVVSPHSMIARDSSCPALRTSDLKPSKKLVQNVRGSDLGPTPGTLKVTFVKSLTSNSLGTSAPKKLSKERLRIRNICSNAGDPAVLKDLLELLANEYKPKLERYLKEEALVSALVKHIFDRKGDKPKIIKSLQILAEKNESFKSLIINEGGFALARLVLSDCDKIRRSALECLILLVRSRKDQDQLREVGLVGSLLHSLPLQTEPTDILLALELLCRVTHGNSESQQEASINLALDQCIGFLQSPDFQLKSKALRALSGICSYNSRIQADARDKGALSDVCRLLNDLAIEHYRTPFNVNSLNQQLAKNCLFALADLVRDNLKSQKVAKSLKVIPAVLEFTKIRALPSMATSYLGFAEKLGVSFTSRDVPNQWSAAAVAIEALVSCNSKNQSAIRDCDGVVHLLNMISAAKAVLVHARFDENHSALGLESMIKYALNAISHTCSMCDSNLGDVMGPALLDACRVLLERKETTKATIIAIVSLLLDFSLRKNRWRDSLKREGFAEIAAEIYSNTFDTEISSVICKFLVVLSASPIEPPKLRGPSTIANQH